MELLVSWCHRDLVFLTWPFGHYKWKGTKAIYGVGGGITWDSNWEAEYEETKQKAAVLYRQNPKFNLISTGRVHQGKLLFLEEHMKRLQESSRYFDYPSMQKKHTINRSSVPITKP